VAQGVLDTKRSARRREWDRDALECAAGQPRVVRQV
jgi:hypothetical protein